MDIEAKMDSKRNLSSLQEIPCDYMTGMSRWVKPEEMEGQVCKLPWYSVMRALTEVRMGVESVGCTEEEENITLDICKDWWRRSLGLKDTDLRNRPVNRQLRWIAFASSEDCDGIRKSKQATWLSLTSGLAVWSDLESLDGRIHFSICVWRLWHLEWWFTVGKSTEQHSVHWCVQKWPVANTRRDRVLCVLQANNSPVLTCHADWNMGTVTGKDTGVFCLWMPFPGFLDMKMESEARRFSKCCEMNNCVP